MNSFDFMVNQLTSLPDKKTISKVEYQRFCKGYIIYKLRDVSFGRAFTQEYQINDSVLANLSNDQTAKFHIENLGYIETI